MRSRPARAASAPAICCGRRRSRRRWSRRSRRSESCTSRPGCSTRPEAGLAAGGEEGPVHSAALLVADEQPWPLVDLRVDWDERDPVAVLRDLWTAYQPQMQDYVTRALDPASAPAYGVPGDP